MRLAWLPPLGFENAYELAVNDDSFLLYRLANARDAKAFSDFHGHSLAIGHYVFRSDPPGQYKIKGLEAINLPDEEVGWSPLIADEKFAKACE